jgi:streptogramin lyase
LYLIQLLLPRVGVKGGVADDSDFALTRAELVDAFDGVTAYLRSPAQGAWTAPDGQVERDEVVMVEVLADAFDRVWWREYAARLARRFDQEQIHVRALSAETP